LVRRSLQRGFSSGKPGREGHASSGEHGGHHQDFAATEIADRVHRHPAPPCSSGDLFHAGSGGIDQRSRGIDLLLIERAAREAQSQRELQVFHRSQNLRCGAAAVGAADLAHAGEESIDCTLVGIEESATLRGAPNRAAVSRCVSRRRTTCRLRQASARSPGRLCAPRLPPLAWDDREVVRDDGLGQHSIVSRSTSDGSLAGRIFRVGNRPVLRVLLADGIRDWSKRRGRQGFREAGCELTALRMLRSQRDAGASGSKDRGSAVVSASLKPIAARNAVRTSAGCPVWKM